MCNTKWAQQVALIYICVCVNACTYIIMKKGHKDERDGKGTETVEEIKEEGRRNIINMNRK